MSYVTKQSVQHVDPRNLNFKSRPNWFASGVGSPFNNYQPATRTLQKKGGGFPEPLGFTYDAYCGYVADQKTNKKSNYTYREEAEFSSKLRESKQKIFIQICLFPVKGKNGKKVHNMRIFKYWDNGKFENVKNYRIKAPAIEFIRKKYKVNQYKTYSTKDFQTVPIPNINDTLLAQSELLDNSNSAYNNCAPYTNL